MGWRRATGGQEKIGGWAGEGSQEGRRRIIGGQGKHNGYGQEKDDGRQEDEGSAASLLVTTHGYQCCRGDFPQPPVLNSHLGKSEGYGGWEQRFSLP